PSSSTAFPYTTLFRSRCGGRAFLRGSDRNERLERRPEESAQELRSPGGVTGCPETSKVDCWTRRRLHWFVGRLSGGAGQLWRARSEEHTSELQSLRHL